VRHHLGREFVPPLPVFKHILIHEHIHMVVPPREVVGKLRNHLPEFWEMEADSSAHVDRVVMAVAAVLALSPGG
jgi:hypothetical protein